MTPFPFAPPLSSTSLFTSPNKNKSSSAKYLMAKASNMNAALKSHISSNPYLMNCIEEIDDKEEEIKVFEYLFFQLGECNALLEQREETITELEKHARDHADKITDLEDDLDEEQSIGESPKETQTFDLSNVKETHDSAFER